MEERVSGMVGERWRNQDRLTCLSYIPSFVGAIVDLGKHHTREALSCFLNSNMHWLGTSRPVS